MQARRSRSSRLTVTEATIFSRCCRTRRSLPPMLGHSSSAPCRAPRMTPRPSCSSTPHHRRRNTFLSIRAAGSPGSTTKPSDMPTWFSPPGARVVEAGSTFIARGWTRVAGRRATPADGPQLPERRVSTDHSGPDLWRQRSNHFLVEPSRWEGRFRSVLREVRGSLRELSGALSARHRPSTPTRAGHVPSSGRLPLRHFPGRTRPSHFPPDRPSDDGQGASPRARHAAHRRSLAPSGDRPAMRRPQTAIHPGLWPSRSPDRHRRP